MSLPTLAVLVAVSLGCQAGPAPARKLPSPDSSVVLDQQIRSLVGLPETHPEVTSETADGRMKYVFHLQNQTNRELRLQIEATFYDKAGVPVDDQLPRFIFLAPSAIQALAVDASTRQAARVLVQVRAAR
jgi:uncharacterized protein YcfL